MAEEEEACAFMDWLSEGAFAVVRAAPWGRALEPLLPPPVTCGDVWSERMGPDPAELACLDPRAAAEALAQWQESALGRDPAELARCEARVSVSKSAQERAWGPVPRHLDTERVWLWTEEVCKWLAVNRHLSQSAALYAVVHAVGAATLASIGLGTRHSSVPELLRAVSARLMPLPVRRHLDVALRTRELRSSERPEDLFRALANVARRVNVSVTRGELRAMLCEKLGRAGVAASSAAPWLRQELSLDSGAPVDTGPREVISLDSDSDDGPGWDEDCESESETEEGQQSAPAASSISDSEAEQTQTQQQQQQPGNGAAADEAMDVVAAGPSPPKRPRSPPPDFIPLPSARMSSEPPKQRARGAPVTRTTMAQVTAAAAEQRIRAEREEALRKCRELTAEARASVMRASAEAKARAARARPAGRRVHSSASERVVYDPYLQPGGGPPPRPRVAGSMQDRHLQMNRRQREQGDAEVHRMEREEQAERQALLESRRDRAAVEREEMERRERELRDQHEKELRDKALREQHEKELREKALQEQREKALQQQRERELRDKALQEQALQVQQAQEQREKELRDKALSEQREKELHDMAMQALQAQEQQEHERAARELQEQEQQAQAAREQKEAEERESAAREQQESAREQQAATREAREKSREQEERAERHSRSHGSHERQRDRDKERSSSSERHRSHRDHQDRSHERKSHERERDERAPPSNARAEPDTAAASQPPWAQPQGHAPVSSTAPAPPAIVLVPPGQPAIAGFYQNPSIQQQQQYAYYLMCQQYQQQMAYAQQHREQGQQMGIGAPVAVPPGSSLYPPIVPPGGVAPYVPQQVMPPYGGRQGY
eukprot:m51a1_g9378 hypothetical protein (844) ;mRNA; f:208270-210995